MDAQSSGVMDTPSTANTLRANTLVANILPKWAETIRRKYLGGEASLFLLHGNVFDDILHQGCYYTLVNFLTEVLLGPKKDTVLVYDPSAGARYAKRTVSADTKPLAANADADQALALLEQELFVRHNSALIITYAAAIAPAGEDSFLAYADRMAAIRLHRWSMSPELSQKDNVVFLISESAVAFNQKIIANPRVATIEIPLPDSTARAAVIAKSDPDIDDLNCERLAQYTAGLRAVQIAQILTPQVASFDDAERLALIHTLLGQTPDAQARATKLAAITQGMAPDEIRHLINPASHVDVAVVKPDPYADVIRLVQARKREIIEKECAGLIEFVEGKYGLDAVGGLREIKRELMEVAQAVKSGDTHRVPMGLLFVGPMGTGKTFVAKCFAKESGLSAVTLKNFRSKWVGSTESNLEKVLGMVKALGPIILIIDEGDRSFGGDDDGGTSSRVIARLKEFMSDTENRGLVLFIMMTNRPDKLDIDIKRAGRLDRKIPFFYPDQVADVEAVLTAIFKRYKMGVLPTSADNSQSFLEPLLGYSSADLEAMCLLALDFTHRENIPLNAEIFKRAIADYVPARDALMLEYMELLAVFEASRRSMLPERYQSITQEELSARLAIIRAQLP